MKRFFAWVLTLMMIFTTLPGISLTAFAEDGDVEAKWGADVNSLTESGTLADAIAAAAEDSNVKYIQLQSDVASKDGFLIRSGEFTIDLNGNDVSSSTYTFDIENSGTRITLVDNAGDGKVSTTDTGASAVVVSMGASVTINGGEYEGICAIIVWDSSSSATVQSGTFASSNYSTVSNMGTLLIEGGEFNAGSWSAVCTDSSSVSTTIAGGTFTAGDFGMIQYCGGVLDLSGHSDVEDISVYIDTEAAVTPGDDTIKLSEGYCFYNEDDTAVASLAVGHTYTIGAVQTGGGTTDPVTTYDLWVGGTQVTSANAEDVFGDGTATYDPDTNTLTLNGYTYEGAGYSDAAIYYGGTDVLNLELVGENSVTQTGSTSGDSYGVYAGGSITVSGTGSLTGTGAATGEYSLSYGVYAGGSITVSGGALNGTGGEAMYSYGVFAFSGDISVESGSLTGNGGEAIYESYGVLSNGSITVSGTGSLTGTGGENTGESSTGVFAYGDISVESGSLTATGGEADNSIGVFAVNGDITVSGGELTATGGEADNSTGVLAWGDITVSSGSLTGNGGEAPYSYGVFAGEDITITVSGGVVVAQGETQAFNKAPVIDRTFTNAKVWYGDDKTAANTAGAQNISELSEKYAEKYVCIGVVSYNLYVGGQQLTSDKLTIEDENGGTATYDPETNTLTLDHYTYEGEGYYGDAIFYGDRSVPLNIVLKGESSITHIGSDNNSCGVYSTGSLAFSADSTGSLTAIGGEADSSTGVLALGDISISGGSLTGKGGKAADSKGVRAANITISGGSLTGIGGEADNSTGVYAFGNITISGGELTATGGEADNSSGVYAMRDISISGGELTATGGEADNSTGVYTYEGPLSISGGVVVAQGETGAFPKAPTIDEAFTDAKVWYGDDETSANITGEGNAPTAEDVYTTNKYVRIAAEPAPDAFEILSGGATDNQWTAAVAVPTSGTYILIFADYDEEGRFNQGDFVTFTANAPGVVDVTSENDITLGEGDKIMVWSDNFQETMVPMCKPYILN